MIIKKNYVLWLFLLIFCLNNISAALHKKSIRALKTESTINLDGKLNESDWLKAESGSDFIMFEPKSGDISPYKTEFKVLFSDKYIY